nr:GGDEF domain-containing protein [Micromonospora sp. DSM 115978]
MNTAGTMSGATWSAAPEPAQSEPDVSRPCGGCGRPLTDPLTGLLDRATWTVRADAALDRCRAAGQPTALTIIDLDWFKRINDTFGHPAGDAVVRAVASVLRDRVATDAVVGRYGGHADEFLILLPGTALAPARAAANAILGGIRELTVRTPAARDRTAVIAGLTASGGVAALPPDDPATAGAAPGGDLSDLLLDADVALRAAKRGGRDRICVLPA